jgi:glycine cleavage system H protein
MDTHSYYRDYIYMTKYTFDNVFVRKERGKKCFYLGISELFVETFNRVEFIDFPDIDEIVAGDTLCVIDTIDETYEFVCPVSGKVVEINEELKTDPHCISDDTEYTGWICKIIYEDTEEFDELMTFDNYKEYFEEQEHHS